MNETTQTYGLGTNVPLAAEQQINKFGKFKDADVLYAAYKNLESEFTRRNQELKTVREEAEQLQSQIETLQSRLAGILQDEEFIDQCVQNEEIYSRAVLAFLNSKANTPAVPVLNSEIGQAAATALGKPKTLEEAKKLAELIL